MLEWLLNRFGVRKKSKYIAEMQQWNPNLKFYKRVPKWCHAGKKGKEIFCPECGAKTLARNFAWSSLRCESCHADVGKYFWFIQK